MTVFGVIDIGTNTTRLLVRDFDNPGVDIERKIRITKLGLELEATGMLGEQGQIDTCVAVHDYVQNCVELGADKADIHIFATAAARNAKNGREFIDYLSQETGCSAEIISGEQEGNYAFTGAISSLKSSPGRSVVFDIGGGSTEFAISDAIKTDQCEKVTSIPIGSVRITKRYLESDPPKSEELANAIGGIREYLKDVVAQIPEIAQATRWVGVAATVTTTAAVEIGLAEFDASKIHEFVLKKEMVEDVFRTLATESLDDRIHNPGLEKERADVIVGGVAIIVAIMRHFELKEMIVSCSDLLDGLALLEVRPSL